ncbi:MAG: hypothetical protein BEN18_01195 [Epulopiscium sp. Nuni2H_MBin001]|nr:MAG: hypothetical protein BEN18_01195 [Epulopiscium sp. Nuni2H_MBin001]
MPEKFESLDMKKQKQEIIKSLEEKKFFILKKLEDEIAVLGFEVNILDSGLSLLPIDDEDIDEDNFQATTALAELVIEEIHILEDTAETALENLMIDKLIYELSILIKALKTKYRHYEELDEFFENIFDDVVDNAELFTDNQDVELEALKGLMPIVQTKGLEDVIQRYEVNVLVDNSGLVGAPVITSRDLSYSKLIGSINLTPDQNLSVVDVLGIESGLLHEARGGYLILWAQDVIEASGAWQAIRQTLISNVVKIQNPQAGVNKTKYIDPEGIVSPVKIILVGNFVINQLFQNYDPEFASLFKFNVDFEDELPYCKEIVEQIGYKVKQQCEQERLKPVTCEALLRVIRHTQRRRDRVSTNLSPIYKLVREADAIAINFITSKNIEQAINLNRTMFKKLTKSIRDDYKHDRTLVNVRGRKIGQINGLAVYEIGEQMIGQPVKITATTYKGRKGVINVEKAAGLSGNVHTKGIEIIEGFLGHHFAQNLELGLSCKICMEQNYGGVDGDSASSAQLYAVISSLAQMPINQSIAVTGSINQFGEIQPVGGVSEKIEGFFEACKQKGEILNQGVIIPYQNQIDLVLSEEIIKAIKDGIFHIYPIKRYEQGIELLMDESYQKIEARVYEKLKHLSKHHR